MKPIALALAGLLLCGNALAAEPSAPADLHDSDATFEQYKTGQRANYAAVVAEYRAASAATPGDLALAVAHCKFIENFEYDDFNWQESASDDLAACREALVARAGQAPEVRAYQLEYLPADEALAQSEAIWTSARSWPPALRARIAARISELYEDEDEDKAGHYAVVATRLGHADRVEDAISHLAGKGERKQASALAAASPPATSAWHAGRRINALVELGDSTAARRELDRSLRAGLDVPAKARIDAYLADKDIKAANAAAKQLENEYGADTARFDLALANGDLAKASSQVEFDSGFDTWIERYSRVLERAPAKAFSLTLLPFTLVILLILACTALIPGLLLVPVHYRGLVRRIANRRPPPLFEGIGLRHAWISGGLVMVVPALVLFVMRPDAIGPLFTGTENSADTQFSVMAVGSLLSLLCLAPWFRRLSNSWQDERNALRLRPALSVVACWVGIFAIGMISHQVYQAVIGGDSSTLQTKTVETLVRNGNSDYGLFATWLLIGVLTPVVEEIVFRGMLLAGMARHITFGWANTLQAVLFSAIHGDPPRFFVYLAIGLAAGWLTRRYRSLLPAIALHALNNTIAVLASS